MPDATAVDMTSRDVLDLNAPPISATSDAPRPDAGPPLSAEVNNAPPRGPDGKFLPVDNSQEPSDDTTTDASASGDGTETETSGDNRDRTIDLTPPAIKREINRARNAQRAAELRAQQAEIERAQLAETVARLAAEKQPVLEPRPSREMFNDPDAFEQALMDWSERRATEKLEAQRRETEAADARRRQAEQAQATLKTWQDRVDKFSEDHPDFDDVFTDNLPISQPMAAIISASPDGPELAYHLGKNPEDAARIAKLDLVSAAAELGKISAKLEAPAPRQPKPKPITPLGARNSAGSRSADEMSTEEYAASIRHRLPYGPKPRPNA